MTLWFPKLAYVKPVQCGRGSSTSLGEIIMLRRIIDSSGLIGYYCPTALDKAKDRWEKWTERRLRACHDVKATVPEEEYENMLIRFPNITFAMGGVFGTQA